MSVGELRTRSGDKPDHREGPQLTAEAVEQRNVLEMYGRYQSDSMLPHSEGSIPNGANQVVNGEPVALNGARRVRRGGWGNTPVERQEGAPCPYSTCATRRVTVVLEW